MRVSQKNAVHAVPTEISAQRDPILHAMEIVIMTKRVLIPILAAAAAENPVPRDGNKNRGAAFPRFTRCRNHLELDKARAGNNLRHAECSTEKAHGGDDGSSKPLSPLG